MLWKWSVGCSDGLNFYINSTRYSTIRFYFKTEIIGRYYCVNYLRSNSVDFVLTRSSCRLLRFLANSSSEVLVFSFIDQVTGVDTFLINKYVINVLSSDEELQSEYRKQKDQ
jgi:hypothetical protein